MKVSFLHAGVIASAVLVPLPAQDGGGQEARKEVRFAEPVRIRAGDEFLGAGRLYPSPVLHDVDGDGRADVVVGDLLGKVTVALRGEGAEALVLGPEEPLKDRRGEQLRFHNW